MIPPDATDVIPLVDLRAEYAQHGQAIMSAITTVAEAGTFILGPQVSELERKLAAYVQPPFNENPVHCIGVSDGTTALQLCLQALKIGPGNEVVTTPFTWISSAEVIPLLGATPIFADIEPDTYVLDAERLNDVLTKRTRAVIAVSLFGLMPDMTRMRDILDEAEARFGTRIALIEDAAQSFGGIRGGHRSCGSPAATLSTTSFFPTKPLSCYGDGGAVFTRDEKLASVIRALRVHGKTGGDHTLIGVNGRLDTVQAAVLLTKFAFFEESLATRRRAAERYNRMLQDDGRIILPTYTRVRGTDGSTESAYGVYTVRVQNRNAVIKRLKAAGVSCAVYYPKCCHRQPVFKGAVADEKGTLSASELASEQVLSLPIHPYLTEQMQVRIVKELRTALDDLAVSKPPIPK